jgi:hypothetical protein
VVRKDKEQFIKSASELFPSWLEFMKLAQWKRTERLKHMDKPEVDRKNIDHEYDDMLDRIIAAIARVDKR